MNTIGEKINKARKTLKITQQELAGDKFTKSYISQIERGKINPSVKALEIIASRLDKPLSYFIDNETYCPEERDELNILKLILDAHKLYEEKKYVEGRIKFEEALQCKDDIDKKYKINIYYHLADIYYHLKEYDESLKLCNYTLDTINNIDNQDLFELYSLMGDIFYELGNRHESLNFFLKAKRILDIKKSSIDYLTQIKLLRNIGILYAQLGNISLAIEYLTSIINISKNKMVINETVLDTYKALSDLSLMENDTSNSLQYLDELLPLYEYFKDFNRLSGVYYRYLKIHYKMNDFKNSWYYLSKYEESLQNIDDEYSKLSMLALYNMYKGKLFYKNGDINKTENYLLMAFENVVIDNPSTDLKSTKAHVLLALGEFYFDTDDLEKSLHYSKECEDLLKEISFNILLPDLYRLIGKILIKKGNSHEGQEYYDKAFHILKEKNNF